MSAYKLCYNQTMNTNNTMTYPQVQAIEPTAAYKKAARGLKTGRVLLVSGIAIAAGLSNGLSALGTIPEHTVGVYGGLIAFGGMIAFLGFVMMAVNGFKMQARDNPNLVKRHNFSNNNGIKAPLHNEQTDVLFAHIPGNAHHLNSSIPRIH